MEIFSYKRITKNTTSAASGDNKVIQMVDILQHSPAAITESGQSACRKIVSYHPANNRTLKEQAAEMDSMKKQRDQGSLSRQDYYRIRREVMGL